MVAYMPGRHFGPPSTPVSALVSVGRGRLLQRGDSELQAARAVLSSQWFSCRMLCGGGSTVSLISVRSVVGYPQAHCAGNPLPHWLFSPCGALRIPAFSPLWCQ